MSNSENMNGIFSPRETNVTTNILSEHPETSFRTDFPAFILMILPAILGLIFVGFGIIYTNEPRIFVFEITWLIFAFVLVGTSISSNAPIIKEAQKLSRTYLTVFALFACVWVYTTAIIAPSEIMANYISGVGVIAILAGLAAAALKRRIGDSITIRMSWALFAAMLLHAPFWLWLFMLEAQNPDFDWKFQTPGYPAQRMYSFSVEAGIAAGLGLFYLSHNQDKLKRILLFVGTTLLWMLLFWSGGRGGFFALAASTVLAALLIPMFMRKMWKFLGSTTTIGAGLSLLLPVPSAVYGLLGRIERTVSSGSLDEISSNRLTLWSDAYSIFLERPVFGHGVSQYRYITTNSELASQIQVHNILLESLISFGLVGTVALIFLLGKIWILAAIRLHGARSLSTVPIFLVATSLLVHGLVSGTYYHIHSVLMIAISLGLLLNEQK